MIQLIAIDLDGTLLNNDELISQRNIEALHKAHQQGIKIVICTGRPYFFMKQFLEEIGLTSPDDYIITYNGALVQKAATGEILVEQILTKDDLLKWQEALLPMDLSLNAIDFDGVYTPLTYPEGRENTYLTSRPHLPNWAVDFNTVSDDHRYNKFVIAQEPSFLDERRQLLSDELLKNYSVMKSQPDLLEVMNVEADKGKALVLLAEKLNIPIENTMAIGDQPNDLPMIQRAGIGVAMANADALVKEAADEVTLSNEEDGVAAIIKKYLTEGGN